MSALSAAQAAQKIPTAALLFRGGLSAAQAAQK